jgi:hypothetical protein
MSMDADLRGRVRALISEMEREINEPQKTPLPEQEQLYFMGVRTGKRLCVERLRVLLAGRGTSPDDTTPPAGG